MPDTVSLEDWRRAALGTRGLKASKITAKDSGAVVYLYQTNRGQLCASGFRPKAQKPSFSYSFRTEEQRTDYVKRFFEGQAAHKAAVAKARAERAAPHQLEVGHILVSSWGYDQTNIDFFQVTRVIGKNTVAIRPVASIEAGGPDRAWLTGKVVPALDQFTGEEMIKRVSNNAVRITSFASAHLWDGQPRWYSSYA